MEGSGKMLVTAVGLHSQTGIMMKLLGAIATGDRAKYWECCNVKLFILYNITLSSCNFVEHRCNVHNFIRLRSFKFVTSKNIVIECRTIWVPTVN